MDSVLLTGADDGELTAFLDGLGGSGGFPVLAYHYPFYRDLLSDLGVGEPMTLALRRHGRLVAVLPTILKRAPEGSVLASLPFFGPNGGVICSEAEAEAAVPALLEAARQRLLAESNPLAMVVYTPLFGRDAALYAQALGQGEVVERFTQLTALDGRPWSKGLRYDIRRAATLGVTVEDGVDGDRLAEFYGLYRQNCADAGIPQKPFSVVETLARSPGEARFLFAYHEGRMVAGLLNLWGPRIVSYYMPCTLADARALQPGSLLIDRAAADARAAGRQWWNWEGSPNRDCGVYHFKQRWNSEESPFRIHVVALCPLDRLARLGREGLAAAFPWFFVYPFDRLPG
ncbi:conserved protein of unknown function （Acyl-CoA N-acyltransferases 159-306&|uniref:GNAT family N-acetyltransferase n=1 Tax=Magnetospirillum sp. XM-1 TaxID=1663591 RepID=UPI00073E0FA9|nr:GNAT family N-acetyltransferase [Magnetospirillum sp. XM-1]CUW38055.1 conserved protein of unknown function \